MKKTNKSAFERDFEQWRQDPEFEARYSSTRAYIDAVDNIIQKLDAARIKNKLSKAELARRIGVTPEVVRRLFTSKKQNPTMMTIVKIAIALGQKIETIPADHVRTERGTRDSYSCPSLLILS
jgi:DNA-binding XRE family transcriptional regulator